MTIKYERTCVAQTTHCSDPMSVDILKHKNSVHLHAGILSDHSPFDWHTLLPFPTRWYPWLHWQIAFEFRVVPVNLTPPLSGGLRLPHSIAVRPFSMHIRAAHLFNSTARCTPLTLVSISDDLQQQLTTSSKLVQYAVNQQLTTSSV